MVLLIASVALSGCGGSDRAGAVAQAGTTGHLADPGAVVQVVSTNHGAAVGAVGRVVSTNHRAGAGSYRAGAGSYWAGAENHRAGAGNHEAGSAPADAGRHQASAASRDPRQIAQQFAMFYARLAANQDEPASQAEVEALARILAPTCSPATFGQYPCVVHLPGRVPPTQNCVAVVVSSGSVTGRCSVGTEPAPVVATGYVDCATVGRVVSVVDVSGDEKLVVALTSRDRLVPASDPSSDLLEVRVASTPTRFCADFRTLAPLIHGSWLTLDVKPKSTLGPEFAPTVNYRDRGDAGPELESPIDTPVAGQTGTSGDWTSLVITSGDIGAPLPDQPFQFRAYANHETAVPGATRLTTDSAPDVPQHATYP